ncbi:MAG: GFA family protein [Janthinobacterium lividum]
MRTPSDNQDFEPEWQGACHCGAVSFRFTASVSSYVACNCTYCRRKAAAHLRVSPDRFAIVEGRAALQCYRFGTRQAAHFFCSTCGVHTHCHPRSEPRQVNVNLRCVDALQEALEGLPARNHDGLNWGVPPS